jgi:hypothetical protein
MQYSVRACSAMAKDSFAQSIGAEWAQLSILAGVIVFISSVADSFTSSPSGAESRASRANLGWIDLFRRSWKAKSSRFEGSESATGFDPQQMLA